MKYWSSDTAITDYSQYDHQLMQLLADCDPHTAELLSQVRLYSVSSITTASKRRHIFHMVPDLWGIVK
jgi:hypothetical protein